MTLPPHHPLAWPPAPDTLPCERVVDEDCCFGHEAALPYLMAQLAGTGPATPVPLQATSSLPDLGSGP